MKLSIKGKLVDIVKEEIYPAEVDIEDGKIATIKRIDEGDQENLA